MLERLSWKRLVLELILCCIPAFILSAFFGYLPWFLLASVTGLLIWHFWNLLRLSWWLWVDRSMTPPPGRGSWEPLLYGLHQMQLRNKKRRRELGNLIIAHGNSSPLWFRPSPLWFCSNTPCVETFICPVSSISNPDKFNTFLLRNQKMMPLSSVGISSVQPGCI